MGENILPTCCDVTAPQVHPGCALTITMCAFSPLLMHVRAFALGWTVRMTYHRHDT